MELFTKYTTSERVRTLCREIVLAEDDERRGSLKRQLPVVTWQARFEGRRVAREAKPSGLFMLDVDHVERPFELWSGIVGRKEELGILFAGMTASQHGLRLVAKCRKEMRTIEECQRWLAGEIGTEYDAVCKDWARSSFVVADEYTYYLDGRIFQEMPEEGTVYDVGEGCGEGAEHRKGRAVRKETPEEDGDEVREGGEYRGLPLETIAREWLTATGGEPVRGERNTRLYQLALRMRYITDFDERTLLRVLPRYGLGEEEMRSIVHSVVGASRGQNMPQDLKEVLENLERRNRLVPIVEGEREELPELVPDTERLPSLPPLLRQWMEVAPPDFKGPVTLCQLPILGALASRLRAKYLDGHEHSPSFQVSLEAPQASGKSFIVRLAEYELAMMMQHDEEEREKEREYQSRVSEMKLLNIKVTAENKEEVLGARPKGIIRYVPATMSITKLLMRMEAARGLHLFAMAEEVDTVLKAFKRSFSSFSDALRVAFDNGLYGQDYASDNSFSGIIPLYYNALFSGTPKAMRRFYPDVEDGLVSRVLFVTLPDQFGREMPKWGVFSSEQKAVVDKQLVRLNEVSIQGDEVQPEHRMNLEFLNRELERWIREQQSEAVRMNDRTRDVFCRRSAVVGFRAGMLCFFLWGEKNTPTIRRNTCTFAKWVANYMLNQHLLRFNLQGTESNTVRWEEVYVRLGDEFTKEELERELRRSAVNTPTKMVVYKWRLAGLIEAVRKEGNGYTGFRKVRR